MNKSRSTILVGIALAMVAMMLMPLAEAQVPPSTISNPKVGVPSAPIKPAIENPTFTVSFTYNLASPAQTANAGTTPSVNIHLIPTCTNGVLITGATSTIVSIQPGQSTQFPGSASFQVSIPRTAPGLTPLQCSFKISADAPNQSIGAAPEVQVPFSVTAAYYSVNQVKLGTKLKQSGPQKQVPFEMEITNFGNARTQYTFELTNKPAGKWNAILPEVLLVDSPNTGQGSPTTTTTFTVATPFKNGWNNIEGSYQLTIKPSAADDPTQAGNPMTANMLVRVRGVYVPGLEPAIMLAAILGSALVLRLRKAE